MERQEFSFKKYLYIFLSCQANILFGVMFQWKERCAGGKCRGRGGADLGQAQKEQKGWVALGPYFPFGIEPSTLIHQGTLPQP